MIPIKYKTVLFDLDDTLYPEIEFVRSGFRAVAQYISRRFGIPETGLFKQQLDILARFGRGKVFDILLKEIGLESEIQAMVLVFIYRSHLPSIELTTQAREVISYFQKIELPMGLISDGMASVQRRKVASLGLDNILYPIVCSDELGENNWKPSNVPYRVALELIGVQPGEAVYVGNDMSKDFAGANELGMLTIYVGEFNSLKEEECDCLPKYKPSRRVNGLLDIIPIVTGKVENNPS